MDPSSGLNQAAEVAGARWQWHVMDATAQLLCLAGLAAGLALVVMLAREYFAGDYDAA